MIIWIIQGGFDMVSKNKEKEKEDLVLELIGRINNISEDLLINKCGFRLGIPRRETLSVIKSLERRGYIFRYRHEKWDFKNAYKYIPYGREPKKEEREYSLTPKGKKRLRTYRKNPTFK